MPMLGLKIDVDTYWGMKNGVPCLLQTLKEFNLKGTFFLSIGPDNSGNNNVLIFGIDGQLPLSFNQQIPVIENL